MKVENAQPESQEQVQSEQPVDNKAKASDMDDNPSLKKANDTIRELQEERERLVKFNETVKQEKRELKSKYGDVNPADFEQFLAFKEKAKEDKVAQLVSEGRTEEARKLLAEDQANAFKQTETEYIERITKLQSLAESLEAQYTEQISVNQEMRKRQYFDSLVRDDASFHSHHFEAFVRLNKDRLEIDESNGKFYALNDSGKGRMVDAKGEFVTFDQFYQKEKATPGGLFWKAGTGTGIVSANGALIDKPYAKMTQAEKIEFKNTFKDESSFMQEISRQRRAGK